LAKNDPLELVQGSFEAKFQALCDKKIKNSKISIFRESGAEFPYMGIMPKYGYLGPDP
jgi:hypothetical protein